MDYTNIAVLMEMYCSTSSVYMLWFPFVCELKLSLEETTKDLALEGSGKVSGMKRQLKILIWMNTLNKSRKLEVGLTSYAKKD